LKGGRDVSTRSEKIFIRKVIHSGGALFPAKLFISTRQQPPTGKITSRNKAPHLKKFSGVVEDPPLIARQ
jgi:hypothetical protein